LITSPLELNVPTQYHRWIFAALGLGLLVLTFFTPGYPGSADAMTHFLISQLAFEKPELFLDQWNKPLFTLISAPFAQFGYMGMRILNTLIGVATALILYVTVRKDSPNLAIVAPFILVCMPQYLNLLPSAMTEPMFGLLIAGSIFAIRSERLRLALILIGLCPFARQEGYVLIPVVLIYLAFAKSWMLIPFLSIGAVCFGLASVLIIGDPLWLINSFPYGSAASDIYGSGTWTHFIKEYELLIGIPNTVLLVAGLIAFFAAVFTKQSVVHHPQTVALAFSALVFGLFLFGHTYLWATGSSGSVGLVRVLASAASAAAYLCFFGLASIWGLFKNERLKPLASIILIILLITQVPFAKQTPQRITNTEEVLMEVAEWLDTLELVKGEIYYSDPSIYFFTGGESVLKHPTKIADINSNNKASTLKEGDFVIWDAHFSPNEGRLPLDSLILDPYMKTVKRFTPKEAFKVLGGYPFEVIVFQKTDKPIKRSRVERVRMTESFEETDEEGLVPHPQGNGKCHISNEDHMYVTVRDLISKSDALGNPKITASARVYFEDEPGNTKFSLVSSISQNDVSYHYYQTGSESLKLKKGWNELSHAVSLPSNLPAPGELAVYIWFREGSSILVDDLTITEELVVEQ
jgi:hypothetical protein